MGNTRPKTNRHFLKALKKKVVKAAYPEGYTYTLTYSADNDKHY
jgi:hypothetical protein